MLIHKDELRGEGPFRLYEDGYNALLNAQGSLNIVDVLLETPSCAIMHFEPPEEQPYHPESLSVSKGVMMAANYHMGHSEGYHKVIVQSPMHPEQGQWMLWVPPGANNRTFYRWSSLPSFGRPNDFEARPTNELKIREYFLHCGPDDEAIQAFENQGFSFEDRLLGQDYFHDEEFDRLRFLSSAAGLRWDPLAEK